MNKPQMGQQPAPSGTPSLNFQSDPNMRSQFKGFMSGMAARNMPAPQPQPAMMMPSMPQQMSSVDIFQPVQSFRAGGRVGRQDYQGAPISGVTGNVAGSTTSDVGSGFSSFDDFTQGDDDGGRTLQQILSPTSVPAITGLYNQGIASLQDLFNNRGDIDRLVAADANMGSENVDALQEQVDRMRRNEVAADQARRNAAMQNAAQSIQSVIQGNLATSGQQDGADFAALRDADMDLLGGPLDTGPETQDMYDQRQIAEYISGRGGTVDVNPVTGQVTGNIDQIFDIDTSFTPSVAPSAPPSRPSFGAVGNQDVYGIGEGGEFGSVTTPAAQMESILDRAARKDDMSGARQLVQSGFGAGMTPMEQLEARGSREYAPLGASNLPTIGSAIQGGLNALGRGASSKLLEKINQGGIPEYDQSGQIVGAYMPDSGLFGSTTYFGNTDFRNPQREMEIAKRSGASTLPDSVRQITDPDYDFGDDSDAADSFLRRLVQGNLFAEGGEVPTPFRAGGGVGRQDYEGASMSGVSGDVAGSSTSDAGSMGSQGQQASGRSFSGADLYDGTQGDENRASVSAATVSQGNQQTGTGDVLSPVNPDTAPTTVSQGEILEPTAQQPMSIRDRIASVSQSSTPTIGSLLGDLFDFSSDANAMSDLERTQLEVRNRMAQRGSDYYGQNITPSVEQAYNQAGMAVSPAAALQSGVPGGQRVNVPVAAQFERYNPMAAGVQQGVQTALGSVRGAFGGRR